MVVHNYRALRGGEIAQFNFHQCAGEPCLGNGNSGVLYPPGYAATFVSYSLLGHPFGAMDFPVIFHQMVGAVGMFPPMRPITADGRAAFWGAVTFEMDSFVIQVLDDAVGTGRVVPLDGLLQPEASRLRAARRQWPVGGTLAAVVRHSQQ
jgi:hypothetical protein